MVDLKTANLIAHRELKSAKKELRETVFYVIAKNADSNDAKLIKDEFDQAQGFNLLDASYNLLIFLQNKTPEEYKSPLNDIYTRCANLELWYQRYYALEMMKRQLAEINGEFKNELQDVFKKLIDQEEDPRVLRYLGIHK